MPLTPCSCRDDDPRWAPRYPHPALADADVASEEFRSLGWPGWGLLYHVALTACRPGETNILVEIGTDVGWSTLVLAAALEDFALPGDVWTYEAIPDRRAAAEARIVAAGLGGRVRFHGAFDAALNPVPKEIAFGFVDFAKDEAVNTEALQCLLTRLRPGGSILVDNSGCLGIRAALDNLDPIRYAAIDFPHASWGFWPQRAQGGTPGMTLVQPRRGP